MNAPEQFLCNLCGASNPRPAQPMGREAASCATCGSTVRLRGIAALLTRELCGVPIALPHLPALKSVRGIGMSDPPELAARLGERFDYTNTFYHQAPQLDITRPEENDFGRYDFIVSSEVMEHVPVPVEQAFVNLQRLLKPDGFLVLTVPYRVSGATEEHFPDLHQYTLATVGGKTVLVNRRRDGAVEVFENLCFHGGHGSTVEMRVFTEDALVKALRDAGFGEVEIAAEDVPEFGVEHAETWSLPIVARKGQFVRPAAELAQAYRDACTRAAHFEQQYQALRADYDRFVAFHEQSQAEWREQLTERLEWVRKVEADFEERTQWALTLDKEKNEWIAEAGRLQSSESEAWQKIAVLEHELDEVLRQRAAAESRWWARLGRKLGLA